MLNIRTAHNRISFLSPFSPYTIVSFNRGMMLWKACIPNSADFLNDTDCFKIKPDDTSCVVCCGFREDFTMNP